MDNANRAGPIHRAAKIRATFHQQIAHIPESPVPVWASKFAMTLCEFSGPCHPASLPSQASGTSWRGDPAPGCPPGVRDRDSAEPRPDALSPLLQALRFHRATFFHARLGAPWRLHSPQPAASASAVPSAGRPRMAYYLVVHGECHVNTPGGRRAALRAGDVVLFPHGDGHELSSEPDAKQIWPTRLASALEGGRPMVRLEGEGPLTRLICAYCTVEPYLGALSKALPDAMIVRLPASERERWVSTLRWAVAEGARPRLGGAGVLTRLAEVLVIEVLRRHLAGPHSDDSAWLAASRDPLVAKGLALMHEQPNHPWTVDELARSINASRSVFARRFAQVVGESPIRYLARCRMARAAALLRDSSLSVSRVAEQVGYDGDAAFNRAFRREFGLPPVTWKRAHARTRSGSGQ